MANYRLKLPPGSIIFLVFHIALLKPFQGNLSERIVKKGKVIENKSWEDIDSIKRLSKEGVATQEGLKHF